MTKRLRSVLLLQLVLWPLLFLGAELAYRLLRSSRGDAYDGAAVQADVQRIAAAMVDDLPQAALAPGEFKDAKSLRSVTHPFLGFVPGGALRAHGPFEERSENEYTIAILGGSVAGGFANGNRGGAPERLAKLLRADARLASLDVRVVSFAYGSYKQPQQLVLLQFLLAQGFLPDAVINIDGFNEVALAARNAVAGVHPNYPSYVKWSHRFARGGGDLGETLSKLTDLADAQASGGRWAGLTERFGLWRSSVLGTLALRRVRSAQRQYGEATRAYLGDVEGGQMLPEARGPRHSRTVEEAVAAGVQSWSEGSRSLDAMCRERSIFYLHVLQPTLWDRGSKPLTEEELETATAHETWVEAARIGFPVLRERGAGLRAGGIAFVDASYVFEDETESLYYDACHFGGLGNRILADAVAAGFLSDWNGERP